MMSYRYSSSSCVCRFKVLQRLLMSVLSIFLTHLASYPMPRLFLCVVVLITYACILVFTPCCSVVGFARSRAVMILVAAWALVVNITQEYGLHDQFGIVFICGSAAIVVISVLGTALIVRKLHLPQDANSNSSASTPTIFKFHFRPISRRVVPLEALVSDPPELISTKPVHEVIDATQPPSRVITV
jgi:hypothetical protein